MAEPFLDPGDVGPVPQRVGRRRGAERMRAQVARQAGLRTVAAHSALVDGLIRIPPCQAVRERASVLDQDAGRLRCMARIPRCQCHGCTDTERRRRERCHA